MTIFSQNSIFQPIAKFIKYSNSDVVVINGANKVNSLPLCGVKVSYEQYQRISVQIPKGQTDFVLSFPMLGIKTTFITIRPTYCGINPNLNYLKWKFQPSSDAKWSFTSILTLTGTSTNPIPPILIDNPNEDCIVHLDVLVSAMGNDYLNDAAAFLYLNNLTFNLVHTYNETTSEILAFFNSDNELAGTLDISDIVNISRVPGQNRIIIDESSENNIVLDFVTEADTLQALSAINWVLLDPATRSLPQAADTVPPVITYTSHVTSNLAHIDLSLYPATTFTKTNFISYCIASVVDARDGSMVTVPSHITFKQGTTTLNTIVTPGAYTAIITISDIAGNVTTQTVDLDVQGVIIDVTAPVITFTTNVTGLVLAGIDIADYPSGFTANDAKLYSLLSIIDDIDGTIPISASTIVFKDIYGTIVSSITSEGDYTVTVSASDSAMNTTTHILTLNVADVVVDNAPQIVFANTVALPGLTATVSLSTDYGSGIGTITRQDVIDTFITSITDDVDGTISISVSDVVIKNNLLVVTPVVTIPGIYTAIITVTDSNSTTTTKTLTLTITV